MLAAHRIFNSLTLYNFMHTLYIVATPIGNLEDMTYRAVRTLKEVPLILAEDTRHSRFLLQHYDISTSMESYHDFNKEKVTPKYIEYLKNQGDIALISDAGTPGIADPAFNLVRECVREKIDVRAIPGASAMITALISSGMPTDRFRFENFSPKKSAQRLHLLEHLKERADSTIIFYVSPHHLIKFLAEIQTVFGEIPLALMRELTKKFEEHLVQTPSELLAHYKERVPKGEFVLIFHPQGKGGL